MFTSRPASGFPSAVIELLLVVFPCISDVQDDAVCTPARRLWVGSLGSMWSSSFRSLREGISSNTPRMEVVRLIGLWRLEKAGDIATLHSCLGHSIPGGSGDWCKVVQRSQLRH